MESPVEPSLWAITAYFNPQHYDRKSKNYRLFRRHLAIPLLTVELSFDGSFELGQDAAEILIRLHGGDVLWQKERLLNVALAALPAVCRKVVWMDCDTLYDRADWPEAVSRALDEYAMVQGFRCHYETTRDVSAATVLDPARAEFVRRSVPYEVSTGRPPGECLKRTVGNLKGGCSSGLAWGARREVLDEHGFYDRCIIGGGDRALACGAYGCFDAAIHAFAMNDRQRAHYLAWAEPFYRTVRGHVTYMDGSVFHLWHGAMADRRYVNRHYDLQRWDFDPFRDVQVDDRGILCWSSNKPELHQYLRDYFAARKEDG